MSASKNPDRRFRPEERLRLRDDFDRVYAAGRSASDDRLIIYIQDNHLGWSRLGMSVGRRLGNAVRRNQVRRRLREAYRKNKAQLPRGLDIICVVKSGALSSEQEFFESLSTLIPRAAARRPRKLPPEYKS